MGCGRIRPQSELRRYAADAEGRVVEDQARALPSRGAYVCGDDCRDEATRRRAWGRAFRRAVTAPGTG